MISWRIYRSQKITQITYRGHVIPSQDFVPYDSIAFKDNAILLTCDMKQTVKTTKNGVNPE